MKNKNTPKLRFPEFTDEWEKIKVKDLGQDKNSVIAGPFGSNLKVEDYVDVGIPVLRTQNIERNNFIKMGMVYTSKEKAYELKYHSYVPGDIVFAKLGNPIGKTCRIPFNFEKGLVVADVVRIRPDVQKYSYDFITYSLNSPIIEKEIVMETIGSTRQRLNLSQVRNLKFSISSLKEQTKIAKFLSKVDEKINSLNEKYVEFLNFKKFLMQNLFTQKLRFTKNNGESFPDWETKILGKLSDICTGNKDLKDNVGGGNIPSLYGLLKLNR